MKTTYDKGQLSINVASLLDSMTTEDKHQIIEHLACEGDIVKHVIAQVLDGHTENWSYGPKGCTANADPQHGLDWAMRQVALRAGETAASEINRLQDALKFKDKCINDLRNLLYEEQQGYKHRA